MIEKLPITTENNKVMYINNNKLQFIKDELETFCYETKFSNSENFPKEILFTHELKNNNAIEGYYEDLSSIVEIINGEYQNNPNLDTQRIINLFRGYDYILNKNPINEITLNELYKILSVNLLESEDMLNKDSLYRNKPVYIYFTDNLSVEPDKGFDSKNIDYYMKQLFNYINSSNNLSQIELFLKSQIIHFDIVFIHPYCDINGRTARTTSLWFLNNNKAYPYTIFNRAITYNKNNYYKIIRDVKKYRDITPFLEFVTVGTKLELEKEYIIRSLENNCNYKLSPMDKQMLQYILTNNSNNTLLDIANIYNRFNPKRKINFINDELLEPLFDYGIILKKDNTKKYAYGNCYNYRFLLNYKKLDIDKEKIKRLDINKFIHN